MVAVSGQIEMRHIRKIFVSPDGKRLPVTAVECVDAVIQPGEFISLIGPSGCGKSTCLRMIAGLESPDAGEVDLDGKQITGPDSDLGLVFQDPTLFPWLNIRDNVAFGPRVHQQKSRDEVEYFIHLVGLEGFELSYPHQLSGGMAQRAALARALVNHPKVLLLDEPFGALDAFTRIKMQEELKKLWRARKTTAVMVTHDVEEAVYLSDRIFTMTPRPARVKKVVDVTLGEHRNRSSPEFLAMKQEILDILDFSFK